MSKKAEGSLGVEYLDLDSKCDVCMGSGHITKTVYKKGDLSKGYIITLHCSVCNGTGNKPNLDSEV